MFTFFGTNVGFANRILIVLALIAIEVAGIVFSLYGLNFPLERALGIILIPIAVGYLFRRGIIEAKVIAILWIIWWLVLLVAAIYTMNLASHLPPLITAFLPISYFLLFAKSNFDDELVYRTSRLILWIHSIVGILVVLLFWGFGYSISLIELIDHSGRLKLLAVEPNLQGSTTGFLIFVILSRYRNNYKDFLLVGIASLALLSSLSKGPIFAFVVSAVAYGILRAMAARSGRGISRAVLLPGWLLIMSVSTIGLVTHLTSFASDFYSNSLERTDSIEARSIVMRIAIERFWQSPVFGRGPGDFRFQDISILKEVGATNTGNLWIPQMLVNILHDSGILGLAIYVIVVVLVIAVSLRRIVAGSKANAAYLTAFLFILIASQSSTLHLSAIFGVAAGLAVSRGVVKYSETDT